MGTIITISGPSGSGKTTLLEHLLSRGPHYQMVKDATSRARRTRDIEGELLYLSDNEFSEKETLGEFLWATPSIHGSRYGTLRESVGKALTQDGVSIMMITVEYVKNLIEYAKYGSRNILSLYILSPGEAVLRERLILRGETPLDVEQRVRDCKDWDNNALILSARYPIHFLHNEGTLDEFFAEAERSCRL